MRRNPSTHPGVTPLWTVQTGAGPVIATAIHDGHFLRPEVRRRMALTEAERLREEDPWTGAWTTIAPNRVVIHRSRFEIDLNRARESSVYRGPEEAWGLRVWTARPSPELLERSYALHEAFYRRMHRLLDGVATRYGRFVVFDLHSYNHRRGGAHGPPADPEGNPDINLGTGSLDRDRWGRVADAFLDAMRAQRFARRRLDVRENVRFRGGWLSRWIHETWPEAGCALAIEVKKTFMDEWSGVADLSRVGELRNALAGTVAPVLDALGVRPAVPAMAAS